MSKTPLEVHHFSAKFHRFGLRNGIFSNILVLVLILFCTRIQIRTNLYSFSIGNGARSITSQVHRFSAKFYHFGLQNGIFSKIFVSVLVLFYTEIQIRTNLSSFSIGNGSTSKTPEEVHRFSTKLHRFGLQNGIFSKIFLSVLILFCTRIQNHINLYSFLIGNGSTSKTHQEVHCFSSKFHRFAF